jgi:pimeloyl-ACP methyl ester carboxylesterase
MDASSSSSGASGFRNPPVGPRLFCLGGEEAYAELGAALSPDLRAVGIHLALRAARESIERTAARYMSAVRDRQPSGPYRLLGFSFSGVLALTGILRPPGVRVLAAALQGSRR